MDNSIIVYKHNGTHNTTGKINAVIFYDKELPTAMYVGGDSVGKFQFDNDTCSTSPVKTTGFAYGHTIVNDANKIFVLDSNGVEKIDRVSETASVKTAAPYVLFGSGSIDGLLFENTNINKINLETETLTFGIASRTASIRDTSIADTGHKNVISLGQATQKYNIASNTSSDIGPSLIHPLDFAEASTDILKGYIFGGLFGSEAQNSIQSFDLATDTGFCSADANLVTPNSGLGVTASPEGNMYISSGVDNIIQKYIPSTNTNMVIASAYPTTAQLLKGTQ